MSSINVSLSLAFFSELDLRVFGCIAFVHNLSPSESKLGPRSFRCVFLGYSSTQKGYRCYCLILKKYFVSHDVTFFAHLSFFSRNPLQGGSSMEYNFWENNLSRDNLSEDNSSGDHFCRDNSSRDNFWKNNSSSGPTLLNTADREYFWFPIFESTPNPIPLNPPQISTSPVDLPIQISDLPIQNLKSASKYLLPTEHN